MKVLKNERVSLRNRPDQMEELVKPGNDTHWRREKLESEKKNKIKDLYEKYLTPSERVI